MNRKVSRVNEKMAVPCTGWVTFVSVALNKAQSNVAIGSDELIHMTKGSSAELRPPSLDEKSQESENIVKKSGPKKVNTNRCFQIGELFWDQRIAAAGREIYSRGTYCQETRSQAPSGIPVRFRRGTKRQKTFPLTLSSSARSNRFTPTVSKRRRAMGTSTRTRRFSSCELAQCHKEPQTLSQAVARTPKALTRAPMLESIELVCSNSN